MGGAKPNPSHAAALFGRLLGGSGAIRPWQRRTAVAALVMVVALAGLRQAWFRWGARAAADPQYVLTADKIDVTQQPTWIHTDVKADVVRDARLQTLDIRDRQLLDQLTRAFELHSWVARVVRVTKSYPARVEVELEYRRPVAMVEIMTADKPGLLFIDRDSVLLPSEDFAANQTRNFLRIAAGDVRPQGIYGTPWGSKRILGAARIAQACGDHWKPLGLYRIVVKEDVNAETYYEIQTRGNTRIHWGSAPGDERASEPSAVAKVAHLLHLAETEGPLDKRSQQGMIDLEHLATPVETARHSAQAAER